jgi:hypothetical protein
MSNEHEAIYAFLCDSEEGPARVICMRAAYGEPRR